MELGMQSPPAALPGRAAKTSVPAQAGRGWLSSQPGHQAVPTVTRTCCDVAPGTKLWVEPLGFFRTGSQKSPKDEDCGSLPAWAGSGGSQEMGVLHTAAPEPSIPLLPLSCHRQTGGCSLFYFTHRNYHLLPIFLKLIFGSEQTPREGKAPDKKSVPL